LEIPSQETVMFIVTTGTRFSSLTEVTHANGIYIKMLYAVKKRKLCLIVKNMNVEPSVSLFTEIY
jgi:hypothetical protein